MMIKTHIIIILFTCLIIIGIICVGYAEYRQQNKWVRYKNLSQLQQRLRNEEIESVCFCDEDPDTDIESWYVCGGVLTKDLEMAREILLEGVDDEFDISPQQYPTSTCQPVLKIVTNKGKYIAPVEEHICQNNWQEHVSLVAIWPRLQKEKIEKISFCSEVLGSGIDSWKGRDIPEEFLPQCIEMLDAAMKAADPNRFMVGPVWQGRMKIITDKGKYLVPAETTLNDKDSPRVFGNEWSSYELGKFLVQYYRPDIEYKYSFPPKQRVVAVLLYSHNFSSPLAIIGDKKKVDELVFEKTIPEPNGVHGIAGLYKFTRLKTFGVESKEENGKIIAGTELKPKKIIEDHLWLEKIMDAYETALEEANEREKYYPGRPASFNGRIVFMTQDEDYWKKIGIDGNSVYDDYIKSTKLKEYFDLLGLTKELLTEKTNKEVVQN